jgi:hypothetical protein
MIVAHIGKRREGTATDDASPHKLLVTNNLLGSFLHKYAELTRLTTAARKHVSKLL